MLCFRAAYKLQFASYSHKTIPQYAKEVLHVSGRTLTCMWLLFIFFLSSFLPTRTSKLYIRCKYCTYQMTALLLGMCLFWFGVATTTGELQPRNCLELSPKTRHILIHRLLGLLFTHSRSGMYTCSQVTPGLLNACIKQPTVSKQKFDYTHVHVVFAIYLALEDQLSAPEDVVVHLHCRYHLDLRSVIVPIFRRKYLWLAIILT